MTCGGSRGAEERLAALRERQREACEAFVDAHYRGVYRFFLWLTRDAEAAADLTQETFAAFWQSLDRPRAAPVPDLKAWLYGIARNRWRKRCRAAHARLSSLDEMQETADEGPGPDALAVAALETEAAAAAVAALPPDYREALVLRVFEEMDYAQIGAALGIGAGLARWRVHRARQWLRQALTNPSAKEERSGATCA